MELMDWQDKLRYRFNLATVTEKLIAVNVLVFVFFLALKLVSFLFQFPVEGALSRWLVFPDHLSDLIFRPWTLITYAFMHAGFWHIIGNMIILYFAGRFFLTFFSPKRLLNYYFLGAIAGALLFMLSYNLFPAFTNSGRHYLIGASAAIMAILIGVAAQAPNMQIRLMIFGNIKLWWIAAFFVVKDLVFIPIENPGGHIAHLGGAALGYVYTTQLAKGTDIGSGWEKLMNWFTGLFSTRRQKPFKNVYKNKRKPSGKRGPYQTNQNDKADNQKKIDAILDKISKNGYDSLTKAEKEFLFNAGKD